LIGEEECRAAAQEALDSLPRWVRERVGEHYFGLNETKLAELGYG
jgi:hypothetical protein